MQLGFVTAILPDLSFEQVVDFASATGYACIEVMCWPQGKAERRYAGITHIDCAALTASEAERLVNYAADRKVGISGLGYYPNALSPVPDEAQVAVEQIHRVIDAAARMGVGVMNTFIGRDWKLSVDENWPRMVETWRPILEHARTAGVKIGIENCPMLFTRDEWPGGKNLMTTPVIWRRMFKEFEGSSLGLNFDPSHFVWQGMDYLTAIREFAPRFWHCHAKDARLDREKLNQVGIMAHTLEFHTPKLPGLGDVNWGQFFSTLADAGYTGAVCVEVEDRAYEGSLAARQASLVQSFRYLRQFVEPY
jgi:sugar phosphate isomerase/epimerase